VLTEQELNYLSEKKGIIKTLKKLECTLLRDGDDLDFALNNIERKRELFIYLTSQGYICTSFDLYKMNFKKFVDRKVIDIDIEFSTKYLKQYFFDIEIKREFEKEYYQEPKLHEKTMKTLRYMLLLRGKNKKYKDFLNNYSSQIQKSHFFLDKLTKNPFKKELGFDDFIKVVALDKVALLRNIKFKYLLSLLWRKFEVVLFLKRGKIVSIDGVDGVGKSTIIDILTDQLQKPSLYMGERDFKYENFYKRKKSSFLKPISLFLQYHEKISRYLKAFKLSKRSSLVFCDRYHRYSKTATSSGLTDYLNRLFFYIYPKQDVDIVLWNTSEVILSRKTEVTASYIEDINSNLRQNYPNAVFIKNNSLDTTLNEILHQIYKKKQHYA
jgi:thymidylate kinase